jgi:hypothetical protein
MRSGSAQSIFGMIYLTNRRIVFRWSNARASEQVSLDLQTIVGCECERYLFGLRHYLTVRVEPGQLGVVTNGATADQSLEA